MPCAAARPAQWLIRLQSAAIGTVNAIPFPIRTEW